MTETHGNLGKVLHLAGVGHVVYAIDKRFGSTFLGHDANGFSHLFVGKKHEFFNKLVGVLRFLEEHIHRAAGAVDVEAHLGTVELQRTIGKPCSTQFLCQAVEGEHLIAIVAFAGFYDVLRLFVGEAAVALNHCVANVHLLHVGVVVEFHHHRVGEFFLVGTQRTDEVAQALRQHRNSAVHQIDRRCTALGFGFNYAVWRHIMRHVGNVYAHLPQSVVEFLNREGVVEVLGVARVDGERNHIAHVAALGNLLRRDARLNLVGSRFHLSRIDVWQTKFSQYGVHLHGVVATATQHVNHFAHRRIGCIGPVDNLHHRLVACLAVFQQIARNENVGSQELAVGDEVAEIVVNLECSYKHLLLALYNFKHLSFFRLVGTFGADVHLHLVAVERVLRVAFGNKNGFAVA